MITVGYVRVSQENQNTDRQIRNIKEEYPDAIIFKEVDRGLNFDRPTFKKMLGKLVAGDTIVFDSVCTMGRNSEQCMNMYMDLYEKGINLVFLKEHQIDTSLYRAALNNSVNKKQLLGDPILDEFSNKVLDAMEEYRKDFIQKQIKIVFDYAQNERERISKCTKEGIQIARLNGKQIGAIKGKKLNSKIAADSKKKIVKLSRSFNGTNTDKEVIAILGIDHKSFYKYKKELFMDPSVVEEGSGLIKAR